MEIERTATKTKITAICKLKQTKTAIRNKKTATTEYYKSKQLIKNNMKIYQLLFLFPIALLKGIVMQIEKELINDHLFA